jgi:hypothetical protein
MPLPQPGTRLLVVFPGLGQSAGPLEAGERPTRGFIKFSGDRNLPILKVDETLLDPADAIQRIHATKGDAILPYLRFFADDENGVMEVAGGAPSELSFVIGVAGESLAVHSQPFRTEQSLMRP